VTGDVEVLGIIDFHSLMERHPVSEESLAKQMMMVEATSIASLDNLVETLLLPENIDACLHRAFIEGGGSKLDFRNENP
jgi:hypothetical protein